MRVIRLAVGSLLAVSFGIGLAGLSAAQTADIRIAELQCTGDPEVVAIENRGDQAQELDGWKLQSDPATEVFDLSALGGLQPGVAITIQAGPGATGVFKWGTELVFRDNDSSDYARVVDDTGATIDEVECSSEATTEPTPTASPVNGVPDGGGAPPLPDETLTPEVLIAVGLGLTLGGAAGIATLWLRLRPRPAPAVAAPPAAATAAMLPAVAPDRRVGPVRGPSPANKLPVEAAIGLAALGLLLALAFLLFRDSD